MDSGLEPLRNHYEKDYRKLHLGYIKHVAGYQSTIKASRAAALCEARTLEHHHACIRSKCQAAGHAALSFTHISQKPTFPSRS